jgi:hypothetical protein
MKTKRFTVGGEKPLMVYYRRDLFVAFSELLEATDSSLINVQHYDFT